MTRLLTVLGLVARHGKLLLVLGLVAGVTLPDLAQMMKPHLQSLVALLLFLAALRIRPERLEGAANRFRGTLGLVLAFQVAVPVIAILGFQIVGALGTPVAVALILMLAASPISGGPNLAVLSRVDPAPAFRLLVLGTALLPLTVLPVFWLMPGLGAATEVIAASARLLAVIGAAAAAAFAIRRVALPDPGPPVIAALDGLSALAMAVVVIGLMSAVGPALEQTPALVPGWLALALLANFGMQIAAFLCLRWIGSDDHPAAASIVAGNRNIALFLVALPPAITDPILLFIGCYQVPMYTTPLVMGWLYAHRRAERSE